MLLDLLDTQDPHSRLYSLQLLSAILSARPDRTQECVFTAPLGISRLVAVLDDKRDAIRNGITSLVSVVINHQMANSQFDLRGTSSINVAYPVLSRATKACRF